MDKKLKTPLPAKKTTPTAEVVGFKKAAKTLPTIKIKKRADKQTFYKTFDKLAKNDNPPIDERLVQIINAGDVQLTDERFFKLLKESPQYLLTETFKKKLSKWTLERNQKMLNRVQTKLKPERRGRKVSITDEFDIKEKYMKNVKLIIDFKKAHPKVPDYRLNELFAKLP